MLLPSTTSVCSNPCDLCFGSLSEPGVREGVCWSNNRLSSPSPGLLQAGWLADRESGWEPRSNRTEAIKGSVAPGRAGKRKAIPMLVMGQSLKCYMTMGNALASVNLSSCAAITSQVVKKLSEMTHESLCTAPGGQ